MRVIEAKLKVYRELRTDINAGNIFMLHVFEDYDEISKLSAYKKLSWICSCVKLICSILSLHNLQQMLDKAGEQVLTQERLIDICCGISITDNERYVGSVNDPSYRCSLFSSIRRIKRLLMKATLKETCQSLLLETYLRLTQRVESKGIKELEAVLNYLKSNVFNSLLATVTSTIEADFFPEISISTAVSDFFGTLVSSVDVNSVEWRSQVAREVYRKICEKKHMVFNKIQKQIEPTANDLDAFLSKLRRAKGQVQPKENTKCEFKNIIFNFIYNIS